MNYYAWSREYYSSAQNLAELIDRLKQRRKRCRAAEKRELDDKISSYRECYRECMQTANLLMERARGEA